MKSISILGSTGSIGTQALDVIRQLKDFRVIGLAAHSNIELLECQIREFKPKIAAVYNTNKAKILKDKVKDTNTIIFSGQEGLMQVSTQKADLLIISTTGIHALLPLLEAIKSGINIGIATKEILVSAGEIVLKTAQKYNVKILPIDSEHSAIFQCINQENKEQIKDIILTASGGPFRGKKRESLKHVTPEQALKHPNWNMGAKVSIDSATLMNKGLEVIEARWLFGILPDKIKIIIHPQSIIHSMVQYLDGSIIAQLSAPDMRIPIQYALTYPTRIHNTFKKLELVGKNLTFEEPDYNTFKLLKLSYKALEIGKTMPIVLNSSNEAAVKLFMKRKISFLEIADLVEECMKLHKPIKNSSVEDIFNIDAWSKDMVNNIIK